MKCLAFLAGFLAASATAAIPESYEARLLQGTCSPYGGEMQSGTGWGFVGEVRISPSHTDSPADGLNPTSLTHTQRFMSPYEYWAFKNMTGVASYQISCSDENGLYLRTAPKAPGFRIFTYWLDNTRATIGLGLTPEAYGVYVDGERIDGTYIGLAGVVEWGFKEEQQSNGQVVWAARLMVPEAVRVEGEVYGFLSARG
ncbi:uncharacterized protein DNG_00092 [Cephalotrichum gorgonifer]|uniref:Uncharacterized protein n=1 Tax=Cephalotrichum gorgonifer TaxID=2041049 RepID=A0AAE8SQU7_9PEZI|nr:uncharacterized protein DNG_00092 [Cephalotrichum gorgonifer]